MAGSMGEVGETQDRADARAGAAPAHPDRVAARLGRRPHPGDVSGSTFAGAGALFREQVTMSGVVPQVAAMLGHCAAGTAYIPALADFIPMVKGTSSMALGGRHLVQGGDRRGRHRGGDGRLRGPHQGQSGVADLEVASDEECLAVVRALPVVLPVAQPGGAAGRGRRAIPSTGACEELYDIVPTAPRRAYDMRKVVAGRRRRRRLLPDEAGLGPQPRHRVRPRRRHARRHRRQPARWCSAARST